MSYDVAIIGAGHNGLVTAAALAKSGKRVVVCEQRAAAGGLCAAREFHPGYRVPGILHDTSTFRRSVAEELQLEKHGLAFRESEPAQLGVVDTSQSLYLDADLEAACSTLAAVSQQDADAYRSYRGFVDRVRGFVGSILDAPPPELDLSSLSGLWTLAKRGLAMRRLGREDMLEIMRIAPMCVADWLGETFASPMLTEMLASRAVTSSFLGPWSAGSAWNLLLAECSTDRSIVGGGPALTSALVAACREHGVELRTDCRVDRIRIERGRVCGLKLDDGESIDSSSVGASCDPKRALLQLVAPGDLPRTVEEQVRVLRARGTTAKVHLGLNGPLEFSASDRRTTSVRVCGGHVDELERAFDAIKYGGFSPRPNLDIAVPSVDDASLAPAGHEVVSIVVNFAPYDLRDGWTDTQREALGDAVVDRLAAVAPNVRERILAREVLTPVDLESDYGLTGGHLLHGEHALDQMLFLRPAPSCAHYRTPIDGLFLCGSGSHPGGGVTGMPGLLAARTC